jgi:hypothetical protein
MGYLSDVTIVMYPSARTTLPMLKLYADETYPMSSRCMR